ncbi:MAG TPA: NAD(P)-dependent oxidoreductase [Polyangiaceae bacterium]|nr:NAD(P)-dependent oxidoreductase [Polyangiaceae bacterium]
MSPLPMKILLTGIPGPVSEAVLLELRKEPGLFEVHGVGSLSEPWSYADRVAGRALPPDRYHIADLCNFHDFLKIVEGMDIVIHLDDGVTDAQESSRAAVYNVFEASRQAAIRRVIYGSSAMVCLGYLQEEPYRSIRDHRWGDLPMALPMVTKTSVPRPIDRVASGKLWGEALGRIFADVHGLSVICIRWGWLEDPLNHPRAELSSLWCSRRDAAQLVKRCVLAPNDVKFDVFFGVSANHRRWVDIDDARSRVGYRPIDSVEEHGTMRIPAA